MASTPSIDDLADQISASTKIISNFLKSNNLPQLSFDKNAPLEFPHAPEDILAARRNLREATKTLYDLATGPSEHLRWLACHYHDMNSLRWIYHFKIAEAVPLDHEVSFAEVAAKAKVDEVQCRRIMRHAMTNNIFYEPKPGFVTHTAESSLLVRSPSLAAWVGYTCEDTFPASAKMVEATEKWGAGEEKNQTGWNLAFNTDLPQFEYFEHHKDRMERFAKTMEEMTSTEGYSTKHLASGFDWAKAQGTVVDVGGSLGHASIAIAEKAPGLKFIVQDLPNVIARGESALPSNMKDRISFMAHDFFTPQPVQAEFYLLRFILHDYPDKHSVKIVQNLVSAMKKGTRIIVMDGVMPPPNTIPKSEERLTRIMDLEMMTTFNSREREVEDWAAIFAKADPRLKLRNTIRPPGSINSVMEVVFEE
ncbi:MAG: hypothetical protein M1834_008419 [Cirrosporium novae-zelandiae]|nr:MAG: hypothetical protein M1834_008419 [Cirrosporium novae-zelandiae]